MKRKLLIFLLIPILTFSQSKGYFDITKDAFYHEKMSEWKNGVYDDFDCKFNTIVDNDSVLSFSAQGYFFREEYKLTLNREKKIKKIEVFFYSS